MHRLSALVAGLSLVGLSLGALALEGCSKKAKPQDDYVPPPPPPHAATIVNDYASLCETDKPATPFDATKKYEKKPHDISKVAFFDKYVEGADAKWETFGGEDVKAWKSNEPNDIELVACVAIKKKKKTRDCAYDGNNGQKYTLEMYDMTHDLRVIEAKTGKEVYKESFDLLGNDECPFSSSFSSTVHFRGADFVPKVLASMLPLEPDGIELPPLASPRDLMAVCSGVPLPQTAAYDPKTKKKHPIATSYRSNEGAGFGNTDTPNGFYRDSEDEKNPALYQLVACVTGKPEKKQSSCPFDSGSVLEIDSGTVEVKVYETHTAKLVETKTFRAAGVGCPMMHKFETDHDVELGSIEAGYLNYVSALEKP